MKAVGCGVCVCERDRNQGAFKKLISILVFTQGNTCDKRRLTKMSINNIKATIL